MTRGAHVGVQSISGRPGAVEKPQRAAVALLCPCPSQLVGLEVGGSWWFSPPARKLW